MESKVLLSGIYTIEASYFSTHQKFTTDIKELPFESASPLRCYKTLVLGIGPWPPPDLDLKFQGSESEWENELRKLPDVILYKSIPKETKFEMKYPNLTPQKGDSFWGMSIGNLDYDSAADVTAITHKRREVFLIADDHKIGGPQSKSFVDKDCFRKIRKISNFRKFLRNTYPISLYAFLILGFILIIRLLISIFKKKA